MLASGASGLTWEVLWQHHAGLALGVSAYGTAVTLASLMAGMGLGGLLAASLARRGRLRRPLRAYGVAELVVGAGGLAVPLGLAASSWLDARLYALSPPVAEVGRVLGTALWLLPPATAMGATIPFLAPCAARVRTNLAVVYALNILGAVAGVLLATFVALPRIGVAETGRLCAALNFAVGLWALTRRWDGEAPSAAAASAWPAPRALALAFLSGFAVFALEVSWFRSIRAALQSSTETFAILLATFLLALAVGGWLVPLLRARFPGARGVLLALAGVGVLCATPFVDSLDLWISRHAAWTPVSFSLDAVALRFLGVFRLVVIPVTLLGLVFPWLLAEHATTSGAGRLYALNTLGAVLGSLLAGFAFLPWLGATHTSWLAGLLLLVAAVAWRPSARSLAGTVAAAALGLAVASQLGSGTARQRVQGFAPDDYWGVQFVDEGPDSTIWVTRYRPTGALTLVIDGFITSAEGAWTSYMSWMGHLPALAAPSLREALVICFGVGQTANAVREHAPDRLTIVDLNEAVFEAADLFEANREVLRDPRVNPVVMDGRAFLRRGHERRFDLVTLEPMPPNFAGTNSLYSREFYELIRSRLAPGGVAAQWVPLHLVAPGHVRSIVATFHAVFPHTRLWLDGGTGILLGGPEPWELRASRTPLPLDSDDIERRFVLSRQAVAEFSRGAELVTDDNQLLSYGAERLRRNPERARDWARQLAEENLAILAPYVGVLPPAEEGR